MPAKKVVAKKISKKVARVGKTTTLKAKTKAGRKISKATAKTVKTTRTRKPGTPSTSINFAEGTDMATAFEEVKKGGVSRSAVAARLTAMWKDNKTRSGNAKPVSTIINHVVRRAKENGYAIKQTWQLVKADEIDTDTTSTVTDAQSAANKPPAARKTIKKLAPAKKGIKRRVKP